MRRFILVTALTAAVIFLFAACTQMGQEPAVPVVDFSAVALVSTAGTELTCDVSHTKEGVSSVAVTKPEGLKGLSFKWLGGAYSIEYNKLFCQTTSDYLPQQSFARALVNVLDTCAVPERLSLKENKGNVSVYSGNCPSGDFTVTCDNKTGFIQKVEIFSLSLIVDFLEHKQYE